MKLSKAQKRYLATLAEYDPKPLTFRPGDRTIRKLEEMGLIGDVSPVLRATGVPLSTPAYKLTDLGIEEAKAQGIWD